jgi:hypothetical protein
MLPKFPALSLWGSSWTRAIALIRASHSSRKALRFASTSELVRATCPRAFCPSQIFYIICQNGSSWGSCGYGTSITWTLPTGRLAFSETSTEPSDLTTPSTVTMGVLIVWPFVLAEQASPRPRRVFAASEPASCRRPIAGRLRDRRPSQPISYLVSKYRL